MSRSTYSLSRSKKTFFHVYRIYQKRRDELSPDASQELRAALLRLQSALLASNRNEADLLAKISEQLAARFSKKSPLRKLLDFTFALAFALLFAIIVRQMWFEPYEIPTGSMRPTFEEKDRLVVSKTTFGLNIPLTTGHFYFDPTLVQRSGTVTFTGENMDIPDADTRYFLLFPGKKQFVKRLMGKAGDTLYFYGGLIYGIDQEGRDISSELQPEECANIDHIPFLKWEGQVTTSPSSSNSPIASVVLHQMGQPVALLEASKTGRLQGRMLPLKQNSSFETTLFDDYSDMWGFGNFAMARLLTPDEVVTLDNMEIQNDASSTNPPLLYLELAHHPSLKRLTLVRDLQQRLRPAFDYPLSIIPLDASRLRALFASLYTSRFVVKNGLMYRYGLSSQEQQYTTFMPKLEDVPDGTYEFIDGKAYEIGWEGLSTALPSHHPLYDFSAERIQLWFNLGIECNTLFSPEAKIATLRPARYAYFRNGELFVMGHKLLGDTDEALTNFIAKENEKAKLVQGYRPFIDCGPPHTQTDALDINIMRQYGLQIPQENYLALGDNHAMSGDSRLFGFVPQDNLRGTPSVIFWPIGSRWGAPNQPPYPWFTFPTTCVLISAMLITGIWWFVHRYRTALPRSDL
jgi:signal peptidase I